MVRGALDGLNERQRVAIVLNKFEDMNYADIAEVMGLTTKAVKSLLSRARGNSARPSRVTSTWTAKPPRPTASWRTWRSEPACAFPPRAFTGD